MVGDMTEIKDVKEISARLSTENKKYVIAVANALLFSQTQMIQPKTSRRKCELETRKSLLT